MTLVRASCLETTQMHTSKTGAAQGCTFSSTELATAYFGLDILVSKDSPYPGEAGK